MILFASLGPVMVFLPDLFVCVLLSVDFKRNVVQYKAIFLNFEAGGFGPLSGWPSFEGSIMN